VCQHHRLQDPSKFTHIGIFGLKIKHLATLHFSPMYYNGAVSFSTESSILNAMWPDPIFD
jgi:hypothetical protein